MKSNETALINGVFTITKQLKGKPIFENTVSKDVVHTITVNNGSEFAEHKYIARMLDTEFYFVHPYASWERGLNEYTNKLIRQYIHILKKNL